VHALFLLSPSDVRPDDDGTDDACGLATSAQACLASRRCLWDAPTLSCDALEALPRATTTAAPAAATAAAAAAAVAAAATAQAAASAQLAKLGLPSASLGAAFKAPNLTIKPVQLTLNASIDLPGARVAVRIPPFPMPRPIPSLPVMFDPLAALMRILMMLLGIIQPILMSLLQPILQTFMAILSDIFSLLLGPFLFPQRGLPFPFPLSLPPFPAFKLPVVSVPGGAQLMPDVPPLKLPALTLNGELALDGGASVGGDLAGAAAAAGGTSTFAAAGGGAFTCTLVWVCVCVCVS
jgi:hypothetical protein